MAIEPHDLLRIKPCHLRSDRNPPPVWVEDALNKIPVVVVRRTQVIHGFIPVGVRGEERQQRYAGMVDAQHIIDHIKPEQLAEEKKWRQKGRFSKELVDTLELVDQICATYQLCWGPTGSVGFELATDEPVVSPTSDLDCLIRSLTYLPRQRGQEILQKLEATSVKLDIQLEIPAGTLSLAEYVEGGKQPLLLRTVRGPKLIYEPWDDLWRGQTQ